MVFADLPVGAKFSLDGRMYGQEEPDPDVLEKTSEEGYMGITCPGIHGDADLDFPVVLR